MGEMLHLLLTPPALLTRSNHAANPTSVSSLQVVYPTIPASHGELVDSRYRLERLVGEGASSWVFAATDQRPEREVALKLFKPPSCKDDVKRRRRFIAEGRTLAKLVHPHIVAIH